TTVMGDFTLDDSRQLPPGYAVLKPCVTPDYFATMGIMVRAGRSFLSTDNAAAPRVVVISTGMANRFWPGQSALGKRVTMAENPKPEDWLTIVGIVDDVAQAGVADARAEALYRPLDQVDQPFFINHLNFVVRASGDPELLIA